MGYYPEKYYQDQENEIASLRMSANDNSVSQDLQASQLRDDEKNLVKEQLSLADELETIEHLLRGHILKKGADGVQQWVESEDDEMIILTEHGVHLIMNTIMFYMNKNTLLSNYDDETILTKMKDFSTCLADVIFMEYEKVFSYPTFEDCKQVLRERISKKTELIMFAYEITGKKSNKEEVEEGFIKEIEDRIEVEISKIREQIIKNKLKRFEVLIREVQDAVHSTYLRAWNGQERRTLREHIHISENVGGMPSPQRVQQSRSGGFFKRLGR